MKVLLFNIQKHDFWRSKIIKIVICIFLALMYLQGEHFPQCLCVFPDEIMDFQCGFIPIHIEDEQAISDKIRDKPLFTSSRELEIPSFCSLARAKPHFLFECPLMQGLKKRLFLLQQYNS